MLDKILDLPDVLLSHILSYTIPSVLSLLWRTNKRFRNHTKLLFDKNSYIYSTDNYMVGTVVVDYLKEDNDDKLIFIEHLKAFFIPLLDAKLDVRLNWGDLELNLHPENQKMTLTCYDHSLSEMKTKAEIARILGCTDSKIDSHKLIDKEIVFDLDIQKVHDIFLVVFHNENDRLTASYYIDIEITSKNLPKTVQFNTFDEKKRIIVQKDFSSSDQKFGVCLLNVKLKSAYNHSLIPDDASKSSSKKSSSKVFENFLRSIGKTDLREIKKKKTKSGFVKKRKRK
jgi:hypothetical protein